MVFDYKKRTHNKCGNEMEDIRQAFRGKVYEAWWCKTCQMGYIAVKRKSEKTGFTFRTYKELHDKLKDLQDKNIHLCRLRYLRNTLKIDKLVLESYLDMFIAEKPQAIWYSLEQTAKKEPERVIELSKNIPLTSHFIDFTKKHPDVIET